MHKVPGKRPQHGRLPMPCVGARVHTMLAARYISISIVYENTSNHFGRRTGIIKNTGIVRKIDSLGRVVIPKEIRKTLKIENFDPIEIFVDEHGNVILHKYERSCCFCGEKDDLLLYKDHLVCSACAHRLGLLFNAYGDENGTET